MKPLTIIGVTRFSVDPLSIIEKPLAQEEILRRQSAIYAPDRIEEKSNLFNAFTLPSLKSVSGRCDNYFHIVACSSQLPRDALNNLRKISEENQPWLKLLEVHPREKFTEALRCAVMDLAAGESFFNFRIDDDDAISPDFVDAIQLANTGGAGGTVLSFDLGYYVQRVGVDDFAICDFDYPKIAIGLGLFSNKTSKKIVFDLPVHNQIPEASILNIRSRKYWLRTLHSHNDSGTRTDKGLTLNLDRASARLMPEFGHLSIADALTSLPIATEERRFEGAPKVLFHIQ